MFFLMGLRKRQESRNMEGRSIWNPRVPHVRDDWL